MTKKNKTIFTYFVLLLLAAAIIASGRYINSKKFSPPKKDHAAKLAELRADLSKATTSGSAQRSSGNTKRTSTRKSAKAGST